MHNKSMDEIIKKYKALAQECRLRIIHILLRSNTPLCICEMMDILDKEQYHISRCLSILKEARLVNEERDGRLLLFSLDMSDKFNKGLFENLKIIDSNISGTAKKDLERLNDRLSLRVNGKIVVTYNENCCNK